MKYYGVSALALMVGLGACAKNPDPTKIVNTPMIKYKTEKVEAAVSNVPKWYKKLPKKDNSIWCDLSSENMDDKLLTRSDGTSVYMTQDIATAIQRFKDFPKLMF